MVHFKLKIYTGKTHTNVFSHLIKDLSESINKNKLVKGNLIISFDSDIENFDICIISILAIFKYTHRGVIIDIQYPTKSEKFPAYRFHSILYSIRNWFLDLYSIKLYTINGDTVAPGNINEPQGIIPIMVITPEIYKDYFISTNGTWAFKDLLSNIQKEELIEVYKEKKEKAFTTNDSIAEKNYKAVINTIKTFKQRINWKGNHIILFQQYLRMIANFDLIPEALSDYVPEVLITRFKKQGVSQVEMRKLKSAFRDINTDLLQQPSFFILLFSILVNRTIEKKVEDINDYIQSLNELFSFTRNLFKGVKELSKNIIDHTSLQIGIIGGRIYSGEVLNQIKTEHNSKDNFQTFESYIKELKKETLIEKPIFEEVFLDLHVFDWGTEGVISKTISNIESLVTIDSKPNNLYVEDIKSLKEKKIIFLDFFDTKNIKLNHHAIRSASHWGLLTFTNLIIKNKGFVYASTYSYSKKNKTEACITYLDIRKELSELGSMFCLGTFYEITLLLDKKLGLKYDKHNNISPKNASFSAENYHKLLGYKIEFNAENISGIDRNILLYIKAFDYWNSLNSTDYRIELKISKQISEIIVETSKRNEYFIPVIDFDGIQDYIDHTRLLRFLSHLQMQIEINSLIVLNIQSECIRNLNETLNLTDSELNSKPFWQDNHFILVYSYVEDEKVNRLYYTDIFGGINIKEYKLLKNQLASTHTTVIDYEFNGGKYEYCELSKSAFNNCQLFINDSGSVQNFEMVIPYKDRLLFEHSLSYILNTKIEESMNGFHGYKIHNTHFKLGSKTHIKDFVYAKRIFQNSFFTDRFAFLISKYFIENIIKVKSLTVIGYGEYSQLLINRVEKILEKKLSPISINHDMISDVHELRFIKNEPLKENVLIIVPINTTFSTSVKIENLIEERIKKENKSNSVKRLEPSINLILVTHKNLEDIEYVKKLNKYLQTSNNDQTYEYPYKLFYWKNIVYEKKEILVNTNPLNKRPSIQKYFVTVPSRWYLPEFCEDCFPKYESGQSQYKEGYILEKPLLETDKTSVTPDLLLMLPETFRHVDSNPESVIINSESVISSHISQKGEHYLHFINPQPFFNRYLEKIRQWAIECKYKIKAITPSVFGSNILLISPSERNNTYFVEFINRVVFEDSAIIIHYEVSGDYLENYQKFFKGNIKQSNFIYYVDDFIQSGKTFHLVNDFVRYCNNQHEHEFKQTEKNRACDGLFTLISKADNFTKSDIVSQIGNTYSESDKNKYFNFYNLNINSISLNRCPLCKERERYLSLADNSFLDGIKEIFLTKANNLATKELNSNLNNVELIEKYDSFVKEFDTLPWKNGSSNNKKKTFSNFQSNKFPERNYLKFLILHELNSIISKSDTIRALFNQPFEENNLPDKKRLVKELYISLYKCIKDSNSIKLIYRQIYFEEQKHLNTLIKELLIKTISHQPFCNIKCIREKIFFGLLYLLDYKLNQYTKIRAHNFENFREIKLLLRRITLLGSNYIIRYGTLKKIKRVYELYSVSANKYMKEKRLKRIHFLYTELYDLEKKKEELLRISKNNPNTNFNGPDFEYNSLDLDLINSKIKYTEQAIQNIVYIDSTLQGFSYFYVSLVKEITLNNDSKILKLEQNLNKILGEIDEIKEVEFSFLIRLLKYENVSIIKNSADIIVNEFLIDKSVLNFKNSFKTSLVRKYIDEKLELAFKDYRLQPLLTYFNHQDITTWRKLKSSEYKRFSQFVYLYKALQNELNYQSSDYTRATLEEQTKAIIQNLFRVIGDIENEKAEVNNSGNIQYKDSFKSGAFLILKYKGSTSVLVPHENMIISYVTKPYDSNDIYRLPNAPIDENSLSYLVFNGISYIYNLIDDNKYVDLLSESKTRIRELLTGYSQKSLTIWEIEKDTNKYWHPVRGNTYALHADSKKYFDLLINNSEHSTKIAQDFTEAIYLHDRVSYLTFIRLSDFKIENNRIFNTGQGVIGLFSENEGINIERLKLGLITIPLITKFVKDNYDRDSLVAFLNERNKIINSERDKHGYPIYLSNLKNVAYVGKKNSSKNKFIDLLYSILISGKQFSNLLEIYNAFLQSKNQLQNSRDNIYEKLSIKHMSLKNIFEKIKEYYKIILKNKIGGTSAIEIQDENIVSINWSIPAKQRVFVSEKIFDIIITEALLNAKKGAFFATSYNIYLEFILRNTGVLLISITNYSRKSDDMFIKKLKKYNERNTHGLGLINKASFFLFKCKIDIDEWAEDDKCKFKLTFPIANFNT